jgi:hypothetical protein
MRQLFGVVLSLALLSLSQGAHAVACHANATQPLPVRSTPVPPLAAGLAGSPIAFASPHALLAESRDESLALDLVLRRLQLEACAKDEFANYKPRTKFDNAPWRFQAKPGQKFTAAEFDAWMKSRGVRVAKGNTPTAVPAAAPAAAPAALPEAGTVNE